MSPLLHRLIAAIDEGMSPWPEARFEALAAALFARQYASIPAYAALCRARGVGPEDIGSWRDIPAMPTLAFKHFTLFAGDPAAAAREFRTSGTSGRSPGRALFSEEGLAAMAAAIRTNARAMLLPEGRVTRILVLAPPPERAPHMIMAAGMAQLVDELGLPGSRFLVGPQGLDMPGLLAELGASARGEGPPLTLIGASFGFVHLLDRLAAEALSFALPPGSRLMDAGGFKGRSRVVSYSALLEAFRDRLGLPARACVNLLGMTELSSQFYDNVLRDGAAAPRYKVAPPWTRVRVVDPETLRPLPEGETGLLLHLDLASWDRPAAVQTEDLGRLVPGGFEVSGRAGAGDSRGCSITVDELLARSSP